MRRRALAAACALLLAGCASVPMQGTTDRGGRFSAAVTRAGRRETVSGRWRLVETGRSTELTLMTPLYGILARVRLTDQGAELERPTKEGDAAYERTASAEELMHRHLGFALPVDMLSAWLSGRPSGSAPVEKTQTGFAQAGWSVAVRRTKPDGTPALLAVRQSETALRAGISVTLTIE